MAGTDGEPSAQEMVASSHGGWGGSGCMAGEATYGEGLSRVVSIVVAHDGSESVTVRLIKIWSPPSVATLKSIFASSVFRSRKPVRWGECSTRSAR